VGSGDLAFAAVRLEPADQRIRAADGLSSQPYGNQNGGMGSPARSSSDGAPAPIVSYLPNYLGGTGDARCERRALELDTYSGHAA